MLPKIMCMQRRLREIGLDHMQTDGKFNEVFCV